MGIESTIKIEKRYLHMPIRRGAPEALVRIFGEGKLIRELVVELDSKNPDFWAHSDMGVFTGDAVTLTAEAAPTSSDGGTGEPIDADGLAAVIQSDDLPSDGNNYRETLRPQYHFSSLRGWNNDPNGLLYYSGTYHLFYQHNPCGWKWGNMHWGHAISTDLVHWKETGDVLYPDEMGTMYSGSGIVDHCDTSGFQTGDHKPLVCVYTAAGGTSSWSKAAKFAQCLAYSADGGQTWRKFAGNPVVAHIEASNRDPKVIWHVPTEHWIMAIYLDNNRYTLFSSPDLKSWERITDIEVPGATECPDIFELPVDGDKRNTRWIFWGASGNYLVGDFDGRTFALETGPHRFQYGTAYAAQTWSDIPDEDGRRIQIAWLRGDKAGMPFNQQMTFPCELQLRTTPEGIRMFSEPVTEIEKLCAQRHELEDQTIHAGQTNRLGEFGELVDVSMQFSINAVGKNDVFGLRINGTELQVDSDSGNLVCGEASIKAAIRNNSITLRVLADRSSLECFVDSGASTIAVNTDPTPGMKGIEIYSENCRVEARHVVVTELKSIWH